MARDQANVSTSSELIAERLVFGCQGCLSGSVTVFSEYVENLRIRAEIVTVIILAL